MSADGDNVLHLEAIYRRLVYLVEACIVVMMVFASTKSAFPSGKLLLNLLKIGLYINTTLHI